MTPLTDMRLSVIFLNGPIGAGKSTLGRAVASEIDAAFIDGDELRDHSKSWIDENLALSKKLVCAALDALKVRPALIVAWPLRARDWRYFRARFAARGIETYCMTLTASQDAILAPSRGRIFDLDEQARIGQMIAEGYGTRPFSDVIVATDQRSFPETVAELVACSRKLVGSLNAQEESQ